MKRLNNILLIGLTIGIHSCNSSTERQINPERSKKVDITLLKNNQVAKKSTTEAKTNVTSVDDLRDRCVRGQAEPIIKKSVFPKSKFILQPDSLTALETIDFDNGDKLIINNWGCEYYTLTFRFETSRFKADTSSMKYWYVTAHKLMTEIRGGLDSPIDIDKGLQALNRHISIHVFDLKLQTEIDFGGDEIRDFVTLEQIEKLSDKKYAITLSFATGPL